MQSLGNVYSLTVYMLLWLSKPWTDNGNRIGYILCCWTEYYPYWFTFAHDRNECWWLGRVIVTKEGTGCY